jgi:hypothetical protein
MWMTPHVSVIVPAYRCSGTIAQSLGSVARQTARSFEVIVVDDGAPDGEEIAEAARPYTGYDRRFRLIRQANAGACAARNTALAAARGEYLLMLDADDWLEPDAIEVLYAACARRRWAAAHGGFRYVRPDGTPTERVGGHHGRTPLFDALAESNVLAVPSAVLVRRQAVLDVGGFDTSLVNCGDWDLWARVARHRAGVGAVDCQVTNYRMRPSSLSRNPARVLRDANTTLRRIHGPDPRVPASVAATTPTLRNGADPALLPARVVHFAAYAAGLALGAGEAGPAVELLDLENLQPYLADASADATVIARNLLYAASFARCEAPAAAGQAWPEIGPAVDLFLGQLGSRLNDPDLAERAMGMIERLIDEVCQRPDVRRAYPVGLGAA